MSSCHYFLGVIQAAIAENSDKARTARLYVDTTNLAAVALYKCAGFQAGRVIENYYRTGSDALVMSTTLHS